MPIITRLYCIYPFL